MNRAEMWKSAANPGGCTELMQRYEDGFATPHEALRGLCMELGEVESELEPLQRQKEYLREQISSVLAHIGQPVDVRGFGRVALTAPGVAKSYDKDAIKALVREWADDFPEFAERLAACEKASMRAGGLRIEREKVR